MDIGRWYLLNVQLRSRGRDVPEMSNLWAQHCDDCSGSGSTCEEFDPATCNSCVNYDWGESMYYECSWGYVDSNIRTAVAAWRSDATAAEATYGHISTWDTSGVTDMAELFCRWCDSAQEAFRPSTKTSARGTPPASRP